MNKVILTQLTPNNQLRLKYVSKPQSIIRENRGDSPSHRRVTRVAKAFDEALHLRSILENGCKVDYRMDAQPVIEQYCTEGNKEVIATESYKAYYCDLDSQMEIAELIDGNFVPKKETARAIQSRLKIPLDIIKKSQQVEKKHSNWGKTQGVKWFGSNARQKILQAGAIVDKYYPIESVFEVTLTIPGSTKEASKAVADWSGWIVNRQKQVLRRHTTEENQLCHFFVWEHQKRGALHQHWCIAGKSSPEEVRRICRKLEEKWFECLLELKDKIGVDCFERRGFMGTWRNMKEVWQSSVNAIRKSVAAYFSKYCGKNVKKSKSLRKQLKSGITDGNSKKFQEEKLKMRVFFPSRYWGSSRNLKEKIKENTLTIKLKDVYIDEEEFMFTNFWETVALNFKVLKKYENNYTISDPSTGFIYAEVRELIAYFDPRDFEAFYYCMDALKQCMDAKDNFSDFYIAWMEGMG